jgi:hypothetical protein
MPMPRVVCQRAATRPSPGRGPRRSSLLAPQPRSRGRTATKLQDRYANYQPPTCASGHLDAAVHTAARTRKGMRTTLATEIHRLTPLLEAHRGRASKTSRKIHMPARRHTTGHSYLQRALRARSSGSPARDQDRTPPFQVLDLISRPLESARRSVAGRYGFSLSASSEDSGEQSRPALARRLLLLLRFHGWPGAEQVPGLTHETRGKSGAELVLQALFVHARILRHHRSESLGCCLAAAVRLLAGFANSVFSARLTLSVLPDR